MQPFSIICKSCAARLKVSKASAVNQLLACPKCGTMIRVAPPAGWVPPKPAQAESFDSSSKVDASVSQSADPFQGDFDDIDQILAKPALPGKTASADAKPKTKTRTTPADSAPTPIRSGKQNPPESNSSNVTSAATTQPKSTTEAVVDQPMLPNDAWQSDESKKRKRMFSTLVIFAGALLLIGAGIVATMMNLQKDDPAVAKNEDSQQANQNLIDDQKKVVDIKNPNEETSPLDAVGEANNPDFDAEPNQRDPANLQGGPPNIPHNGKINQEPTGMKQVETDLNDADIQMPDPRPGINGNPRLNNPEAAANAPVPIGQNSDGGPMVPKQSKNPGAIERPSINIDPVLNESTNPTPNLDGNPLKPELKLSQLEPPQLPVQGGPTQLPFRNGNQPTEIDLAPEPARKKTGVAQLERMNRKIGDMAGLLEASNTSLTELRDVADQMTGNAPAGLPKYVVTKPIQTKPNLEKLKLSVGGLLYDAAPLSQISRDLTTISGVPFTVDARAIAAAGTSPSVVVTSKVENTELGDAIHQLLNPKGLTYGPDSMGMTITVANKKDFKILEYPVPKIPDLKAVDKQTFLAYIQNFIQPSIWVRPENPATIKLEGEKIVVECPTDCHAQIASFLDKLNSSFTLISAPSDSNALNDIRTRSRLSEKKLDQEIKLRKSVRTPIGSYLNKLETRTGVAVLVDWNNVLKEGWSPQTLLPGNIDEPTVREVIRQIATSMNLEVFSVDSQTMLMTTHAIAAQTRDLEVYPVSKLLAGKLDESFLKEVFETTLGDQLKSERYIYAPNCRCFIVSAPQAKQKKVAALLERLEGI